MLREACRAPAPAFAALVKSCEWQVMQVVVGGRPANADFSTEVWQ